VTYTDALGKWQYACDAIEQKGQVVRNGNWHPIAHSLRHFQDEKRAAIELVAEQGSTAILKVTPVEVKPPPGKSAAKRPAFLLIVR
jgi:hypothetical protein